MNKIHSFENNLTVDRYVNGIVCSTCKKHTYGMKLPVQLTFEINRKTVEEVERLVASFFVECKDCKKRFCSYECIPALCSVDQLTQEEKTENEELWEELSKLPD